MLSERRARRSVVVFMLAWCGILAVGYSYVVNYPIPTQEQLKAAAEEEDSRPLMSRTSPKLQEDEMGARGIKKKYASSKPVYDELMAEYRTLPKFHPPADGHLTEKQVLALYDIVMGGVVELRNFSHNELGESPGFYKAVASYAYVPVLVEVAQKRGQVKNRMTEEEMDWVLRRTMEAALFASNRKWDTGQGTPEEREKLKKVRPGIAQVLGLFEDRAYEKGGRISFPERLDTSKIPRHNLELFLKLREKVRWTEVRFYGMTFDEADIMAAAKNLPE